MRILVIEDDVRAGEYLRDGLNESGYVVDVARDGRDGLHMAREMRYDLIILDVMMPVMDGFEVISKLDTRTGAPVLFLTARDAVTDRVNGLEAGADDYLVKPFATEELVARVRALTRRGHAEAGDLAVGGLALDSDTNVVDVAVRRLRQKIDEPFERRLIKTVHGVGYRCEADE